MNEVTLPPSPNWYLSTTFACTRDGTVAWGARANLIVGKRSSNDHKSLNFTTIPNIHTEKINSLAFCPNYGQPGRNLLVTCGNDPCIKVWDIDKYVMTCSKSFMESDQKVIGVDWSKSDSDMICAISTQGSLLTWQFSFNTCQIYQLGKFTTTCLSCSLHNPNLIAIGTKSGLIHIVTSLGKTIHKLRGHDHEIVSLSWCPTYLNIFKDDLSKDYLLASGAKDRVIYIWKPATDGRYEVKISLPSSPQDNTQHRTKLNTSLFTVLRWVQPNILVVNSAFGELLYLKLNSIKSKLKPDWKVIHGHHSRAIFSISNYIEPQTGDEMKTSDDENWRTEKNETVPKDMEIWTTGQERQVICTVPGEEDDTWNINYSIPTLSGYVYCISPCPLDTSRIAFGVGDGMLRIWNLSEPHETTFDVITAWQDIKDRVTAIAWHPDKENLLAYGTSEGRVGVYDIFNIAKRPVVFKMHHRKTIYRLEWGPSPATLNSPNDKNSTTYSLYCCGDGELTCFNYDKPQQEPELLIRKNCTEISWKPDYSCAAVGYDDGSISFFNKKFESCGKTIFMLKKPVECLAWHPDSTVTDLNFSHFRNYLAVSTTTSIITVIDTSSMTEMLNKQEVNQDTSQNFYKVIANLSGHSDRIYSLAWSPHISGYLVSGSADQTAQVWKIETQEILATYTGHFGGVQSVMWSPMDHNFIFSGSADWSLRIWKYSDQKVVLPSAESVTNKNKLKKLSKKSIAAEETNGKVELNHSKGIPTDKSNENTTGVILKAKEKDKKRGKKVVPYLPNYRKKINDKETMLKSCLELAKQVKGFETSQTIFGSKDVISNILEEERDTHWNQGQLMMAVEMSLWDNKLKEMITKAMETQSLTDFMVSLAPNLSMKFWREVCEAYANQLIQEDNPVKAASYLLSLHKIHAAIQLLMHAKFYKEAYVLAKCKLDTDDDIFQEIHKEWLAAVSRSGSFEEAALCLIANGEFSEAARMLARRQDASTLVTAARLANMDKNQELSDSIIEELLNLQLSKFDYEGCKKILEEFSNLEYRLIQVEAHQEVKKKLNEAHEMNFVDSWLEGNSSYGLVDQLKKKFEVMEITAQDFSSFYRKLEEATYPSGIDQTESMLWLSISRNIALAATAPDDDKRARHIVGALGTICQYELMHPEKCTEATDGMLIRVLSILERVSPRNKESIFYIDTAQTNEVKGIQKSLRVYLCLGLLNWSLGRIQKTPQHKQEFSVNLVAEFVGESLEFMLDQESVKYWGRMTEITKLQNSLIPLESNDAKSEDGDKDGDKKVQNQVLIRLEEARQAQNKFVDERVCAPSPMLVYSKVAELGSFIMDEQVKRDFEKTANETWKKAMSFSNEE